MKIRIFGVALVLLTAALLYGQSQEAQSDQTLDYQINALRSDIRAGKAEIVKEAMNLKGEQADAFWPVYKRYDEDLSKLNDHLVELVKSYSEKFGTIGDTEAKDLTSKALDIQGQKVELKKKYFPIFSKATSPLTAAKFFQVDNRIELLFNLKLTSELPTLLAQPTTGTSQSAVTRPNR